MARDPLYGDGSEIRTQPPTGEQIGSPGRGVSIDSSALLGASVMPQLDVQSAGAEGRGLAAFGQGIASLGEDFVKLATAQLQQLNSNRVNQAQNTLTKYEAEMRAAQENEQDETKWVDIAKDYATKAQQDVNAIKMSPNAKDQVEAMFDGWTTRVHGTTLVNSARKTARDYETSWNNKWEAAGVRGDTKEQDDITDMLFQGGNITEGERDLRKEKSKQDGEQFIKKERAAAMEGQKQQIIAISSTAKPEEVRKFIDGDYGGANLSPEEKKYLQGVASQVQRDQTAVKTDEVLGLIYSPDFVAGKEGAVWNESYLDAAIGGSPFVTPELRDRFLGEMQRRNAEVARGEVEANKIRRNGPEGGKAYYMARHEATAWNPGDTNSPEATLDYLDKMSFVQNNVPDDLQSDITKILKQKMGITGSGDTDKNVPVEKAIIGQIGDIFSFEMNEIDAKIKDLRTTKTSDKGVVISAGADESDPRVMLLRKQKGDLAETQVKIKDGMEDFARRKGGWANVTREDAEKHYVSLLSPEKAVQRAQALKKARGAQGDTGPAGSAMTNARGFVEADNLDTRLPEAMRPYSQDFIDAAAETGMNPYFLAAVSMFETGDGKSSAFRVKKNAMGISNRKGPTYQKSIRDSIFKQARTLARRNGPYAKAKTIDEFGAIYSPPGAENDPNKTNNLWPSEVKKKLRRLLK